ncbi:4Fe-4S single cluster domain-containing protein [soil metagenome]
MNSELKVHSFLPLTYANGPGARCCLWLQGCTLGCSGCFNPETHGQNNNVDFEVAEVFHWIKQAQDIEGLTVSGGEPLQQPDALTELLRLVRSRTALSTIVFTGFSYEEALLIPSFDKLKNQIDVLIAGRYLAGIRDSSGFTGLANKTIHYLSSRYSERDLELVPVSEVIISHTGELAITGVEPPQLRNG